LPFFLTQVLGAGAVSLGVVEGAAEAVSSLLKIASGRLADRARVKRPLVLTGYVLSSAARPLVALAQTWTQVFAVRFVDRIGKGIRDAPRDAMLAGFATPAARGQVYGFQRAMDHAGATIGPLLATAFLFFRPGEYRTLFALAIIPGAIAVLLIFFVDEDANPTFVNPKSLNPTSLNPTSLNPTSLNPTSLNPTSLNPTSLNPTSLNPTSLNPKSVDSLPPTFMSFMVVMSVFTLGNSTDAFLLLRLTEAAGSATYIPLMWAALHVVKSGMSAVGGRWSDRIGRRKVIAAGWLVYAAVYAGFAFASSVAALLLWFLVYGLYFGLTEGTEKAFVADLAPASRRGYAFGVLTAVQGLGSLAASVLFGVLWTVAGPIVAFGAGAGLALIATVLLFAMVRDS
jgi:MFS family permease